MDMETRPHRLARWTAILFVVLLVNTAYIAAFVSPTIFYMSNVLLHLVLGLVLAVMFAVLLARRPDLRAGMVPAAVLFLLALLAGLWLAYDGNVLQNRSVYWAHVVAAGLGVAAVGAWAWRRGAVSPRFRQAFAAAVALLVLFPAAMALYRKANPNPADRIHNPLIVPASMNEEGGGPKSPFFPSSAKTNVGGIIPSNFFMDSEACGECHKDIYEQWNSSAHHFASFNNQFYRKSIEYMQDVVGTQPSKWCAGCHDHAVFFNGRFEQPDQGADRHAGSAGRARAARRAMRSRTSTASMGNGGFTIEYPPLHELMSSKNTYIRAIDTS